MRDVAKTVAGEKHKSLNVCIRENSLKSMASIVNNKDESKVNLK